MKPFDVVKIKRPKKSVFDLSHERKFTMNMGDLVPCFLEEVVPSDYFHVNMEMLMRMQPLIAPIMHRVNARIEFYFVPQRLINSGYEEFITGGKDGTTIGSPMFSNTFDEIAGCTLLKTGELGDYLGLPTENLAAMYGSDVFKFSVLPFRAYQMIYNEYYRDQNLTPKIDFSIANADMSVTSNEGLRLLTMRRRSWERDYFTSMLPTAQRGNPVSLPLGQVTGEPIFSPSVGGAFSAGTTKFSGTAQSNLLDIAGDKASIVGGLNVESTLINDLRRAYSLQRFMEKSMRGGSRLKEYILNIFGEYISDSRIQRPEYLGGGKLGLTISEVLQTGQAVDGDGEPIGLPQGNMSGHGVAAGNVMGFSRKFEEHGYVIGIISVSPKSCYHQGLPKIFSKNSRYDYLTPDFANIGESAVWGKELYVQPDQNYANEATLGYQPPYTEYRQRADSIHGEMRTTLLTWNMARNFVTRPSLNASFVEQESIDRIFAVLDESTNKLIVQTYANVKAVRPLPYFGTPLP